MFIFVNLNIILLNVIPSKQHSNNSMKYHQQILNHQSVCAWCTYCVYIACPWCTKRPVCLVLCLPFKTSYFNQIRLILLPNQTLYV